MEHKLLLIKKSVCLANVFAWTLTFIRTTFIFYYFLSRKIDAWFLGLYIIQLFSSIFISISTCAKNQCCYIFAVILQLIYLVFNIFLFIIFLFVDFFILFMPSEKIDSFQLTFILIALPSIFVFFFLNDFKELELFTKYLKNQSENGNGFV